MFKNKIKCIKIKNVKYVENIKQNATTVKCKNVKNKKTCMATK